MTRKQPHHIEIPFHWALGFLILILFQPLNGAQAEGAVGSADVIVILIDALRSDHMSLYGYKRETTPNLDKFSQDGVTFMRVVSPSSWTKPSIPSLFTALYPSQHGVFEGSSRDTEGHITSDILQDSLLTMAEVFHEHGYQTAAFVQNAQLKGFLGFAQGFDLYQDKAGKAEEINQAFLRWLEKGKAGEPVFVYLHYLDVHWPYRPPKPYDSVFGDFTSSVDFHTDEWKTLRSMINDGRVRLAQNDLEKMISLYDGELRCLDDQIGSLLSDLKEQGRYNDALIVVTADHGEEFLEHGKIGHGHSLYGELLSIPLIMKFPDGEWAGRRVKDPAELIDILPTLLDYFGWPQRTETAGISFIPLISGMEGDKESLKLAYSECLHKGLYQRAVVTGEYKLIETFSGPFRRESQATPLKNIHPGDRVEVDGIPGANHTFFAKRIALDDNQSDDDDEIEGPISRTNHRAGTFMLMDFEVVTTPDTKVKGPDGDRLSLDQLKEGMRTKVNGHLRDGHRLEIDRVEIKRPGSSDYSLEGIVEDLVETGGDTLLVSMMDLTVIVTPNSDTGDESPVDGERSDETESVQTELYDTGKDPAERINIAGTHTELVRRLRTLMNERFPSILDNIGTRPQEVQQLDAETIEELKAIGYIQ